MNAKRADHDEDGRAQEVVHILDTHVYTHSQRLVVKEPSGIWKRLAGRVWRSGCGNEEHF